MENHAFQQESRATEFAIMVSTTTFNCQEARQSWVKMEAFWNSVELNPMFTCVDLFRTMRRWINVTITKSNAHIIWIMYRDCTDGFRSRRRGVSCCAGQPKPWRWRGRRAGVRLEGKIYRKLWFYPSADGGFLYLFPWTNYNRHQNQMWLSGKSPD